jgi:O-antigen/teichoic acid export membrane protein
MSFRNKNFLIQMKFSFIYKALSIIISFLLVKYMLMYLGTNHYGVWAVILAFVNWIIFFDFGIANGVKNKVAESLSKNNHVDAYSYISTGYIILFFFCLIAYGLFLTVSYFVDWQNLLNINSISNNDLRSVMNISVFFILLNFSLSIIIAILNAVQQTSLIVQGQFISQLISLIFVAFLIKFTKSNLQYMAFSYGLALVLSNLFLSFWFYKKNLNFIPSIRYYQKDKIRSILSLGIKFFFLQITILFILTTDTMLITHLLGPIYVTTYDILYKYFGAIMIIHSLINAPLWSMYTEAYNKNDYAWIKITIIKMTRLMILYVVVLAIMYLYAEKILTVWLGNNTLIIERLNYMLMGFMVLILIWYSIFAYFTNGINKTNNQLISASIGAVIHIPLAILFVKYYDMGVNGVILSTIISLSIFGVTGPVQAFIEIKNMKSRI